ncbi:MAG: hypothetical protein GY749_30950 [Desulfobacteraceae bacterium]|nr:hypothetical protein [Desulfobacteraceae bacterium]
MSIVAVITEVSEVEKKESVGMFGLHEWGAIEFGGGKDENAYIGNVRYMTMKPHTDELY